MYPSDLRAEAALFCRRQASSQFGAHASLDAFLNCNDWK